MCRSRSQLILSARMNDSHIGTEKTKSGYVTALGGLDEDNYIYACRYEIIMSILSSMPLVCNKSCITGPI